jgi:Fur family ferric uptake transcriptional regulator
LKNKAKRITVQRRLILDELRKLKTHPDAGHVYELVRRNLPNISLGTVYRNLESLASEGLVQVLESGPGPRRYDGCVEHHYHIRCVRCSKIGDIISDKELMPQLAFTPMTDFKVLGVKMEFFGVCPDCKNKK